MLFAEADSLLCDDASDILRLLLLTSVISVASSEDLTARILLLLRRGVLFVDSSISSLELKSSRWPGGSKELPSYDLMRSVRAVAAPGLLSPTLSDDNEELD
jgi:hypothetical protein